MKNPRVVVYGTELLASHVFGLLQRVARACRVELVLEDQIDPSEAEGMVTIVSIDRVQRQFRRSQSPSLTILLAKPAESYSRIVFTESSRSLSALWHGKIFLCESPAPMPVQLPAGDVLAENNSRVAWITRSINGARVDVCVQAEPWLNEDRRLFMHINSRHIMRLLPFIEWCRALSDWHTWSKPTSLACLMFDDPNLHATHYGYVDFGAILERARRGGYHVSFATVPADWYYVSPRVASLFRSNPEHVSLLVHGLWHTYRELGQRELPPLDVLNLLMKAEHRYGLSVDRVITPPQGAFSVANCGALVHAGFDGACVSWGSLWNANKDSIDFELLGAEPCLVSDNLPIVPRFGLSPKIENHGVVAAYLKQPMIAVGHHWDLRGGIELLDEAAQCLNVVGDVTWAGLKKIVQKQVWSRVKGDCLEILPYTRSFEVEIPGDIRRLMIMPAQLQGRWRLVGISGRMRGKTVNQDGCEAAFPVEGPGRVTLSMQDGLPQFIIECRPRLRVWPMMRRLLVECRDRAMPYLPWLAKRR
jgi:hypothetical protein